MAAKIRLHKGLTAALRKRARESFGVALDEESAQYLMSGVTVVGGQVGTELALLRDHVFQGQLGLRTDWEVQHPDKNPYAPSFPERILALARKARDAAMNEEDSPMYFLTMLIDMCEKEIAVDNVTTDDTHEIED